MLLAGGDVSEYFLNKGYDVYLIDISYTALKLAQTERKVTKVALVDVNVGFPFPENFFDYCFWGDNIEHILNPKKCLTEIKRVLKPGGKVGISFPNMGYIGHRFSYLVRGNIPCSECTAKNPWEYEHIRFFNLKSIKKLLNLTGLVIEEIIPLVMIELGRRYIINQLLSPLIPSLVAQSLLVVARKP